ncbi:hypothetical protein SEA_DALANDE_36 [Gordonia phage DalanDe]|nr:hypothetical protein SEA_DALANDE_36 [Gordonia phage DalanDe]
MSVTITVGDTKPAQRKFERMKRRVQVPDRAWKRVGIYLSREVNRQFSTRGAQFGTPWKPLAISTKIEKRRLGFTPAPLVRTGRLKRGFTSRPMDIYETRGAVAKFGSSYKIAAYQHHGTRRNGRQHIPARPILKVTPVMRREIRDILERYIVGDAV